MRHVAPSYWIGQNFSWFSKWKHPVCEHTIKIFKSALRLQVRNLKSELRVNYFTPVKLTRISTALYWAGRLFHIITSLRLILRRKQIECNSLRTITLQNEWVKDQSITWIESAHGFKHDSDSSCLLRSRIQKSQSVARNTVLEKVK